MNSKIPGIFALAAMAIAGIGEGAQKFMADGWKPVGPGGGGMYQHPAVSPHDANLLFCANDMRSAYRSADGGATWNVIPHTEGITSVADWAFHPTDANAVYAVVVTNVFHSADRGVNWSSAGAGFPTKFTFDPSRPGVGMGDLDGQLLTTTNTGQTWQATASQLPAGVSNVIDIVYGDAAGKVFVGTENGVYRSANDGGSWTDLSAGLPYQGSEPELEGFDGGQSILFATVETYDDGGWRGGVCRSIDDGASWQEVHTGLESFSSGTPHQKLAVSRDDPDTAYMTFDNGSSTPTVYRTTNAGDLWEATFFQKPSDPGYNVANRVWTDSTWGAEEMLRGLCTSDTDASQVMVATITGVFQSSNGGDSWQAVHAPAMAGSDQPSGNMPIMAILGYYFDPHDTNRHYMAGNDFCGWRSLDAGDSWQLSNTGNSWPHNVYAMAFDPDVPGKMWGAAATLHDVPLWRSLALPWETANTGGIIISDDYGATWTSTYSGLDPAEKGGWTMTDVFVETNSPVGSRHLWAAMYGGGIYKSEDGGTNWTAQAQGFPYNKMFFRVRRDAHGRLLAMSTMKKDGAFFHSGGLYLRDEANTNWVAKLQGAGGELDTYEYAGGLPTHLTEFDVDPSDSDTIYVSGLPPVWKTPGGGIWKTSDGGVSWNQCFDKSCLAVKVDLQNPAVVFASTLWDGLYVSCDAGQTWKPVDNFPFVAPYAASFDPLQEDVVYMSTWGGMVWKASFQTVFASWSEDFDDLAALPGNMEFGGSQGTISASVTNNQVEWSETDGRQFVRTTETDYCNVDFIYEATVVINGTASFDSIFFGMGEGNVSAWMPTGTQVSQCIDPRGGEGGKQVINSSFGSTFAPGLAAGTYRLRMVWDADTDTATFGIQTNYACGAFSADYSSTYGVAMDEDTEARLFFGGGSGAVFDDISFVNLEGMPTIMDVAPVSGGNVIRLIVNTPWAASGYAPMAITNLMDGTWAAVPHSDDGVNEFVVASLEYSVLDGTNRVIYVEADEAAKFFRIIGE